MLEIRGLTKNFDGLLAVNDLSFTVNQGEVVGLIGPNGAGKTTAFSLLSGFLKPSTGSIKFEGNEIMGLQPNKIASMGLVRTFQLTNLANSRTVFENLSTAYHLKRRPFILGSIFRSAKARRVESEIRSKTMDALAGFGMEEFCNEVVTSLSHGKQKTLGILMALAADPKLLLLDEPTAGMNASETDEIMDLVSRLRNDGMTVMLVEHDLKVVMGICDRVIVLNFGSKISEGSPKQVTMDKEVISAYLGFDNSGEITYE